MRNKPLLNYNYLLHFFKIKKFIMNNFYYLTRVYKVQPTRQQNKYSGNLQRRENRYIIKKIPIINK